MSKPELDDIAAAAGVDGGERVDEGVSEVVSASEIPKVDPALAHACRMVGQTEQIWALGVGRSGANGHGSDSNVG